MLKLGKVACLSRTERRVMVEAALMLPIVIAALRLFGFRRTQSALARLSPLGKRPQPGRLTERAASCARFVRKAASHAPLRANCLHQSLTLWGLLRLHGIESELRFGARKLDSALEAHAWVEHAGVVVNDGEDVREHFTDFGRAIEPASAADSTR
ncbi:MAG TPA: lasso peptide biosynthesis B2 protein [Blastocatellia bacterium]|nr:lasso peptide biosynthesis B2 protein [Blastocatellia bacterium]